jgi:hypothetical protein
MHKRDRLEGSGETVKGLVIGGKPQYPQICAGKAPTLSDTLTSTHSSRGKSIVPFVK